MNEDSKPSRSWRPGVFFYLLVAAYVLVHLRFEYEFWFTPDSNPFAKFSRGGDLSIADVAGKAYLAKSSWFLLTIILVTFRLSFPLALGIGSIVYGVELLFFFGPIWVASGSVILGAAIVLESWFRRSRSKQSE